MNTTLPTDSEERKNIPLVSGCLNYFPAALAGVARVSKAGNDRHNPGQPLHHARGKSTDHADCILRHLVDLQGLLAEVERLHDPAVSIDANLILEEASCLAWRALALSQELHERFGAPLAPGARLPEVPIAGAHESVCDGAPADPMLTRAEVDAVCDEFDGSQLVVSPAWPEFSEVAPLQLEAGKRYVRRDRKVTEPLIKRYGEFPFYDPGFGTTHRPDGSWGRSVSHETCFDLVAEYRLPESGD